MKSIIYCFLITIFGALLFSTPLVGQTCNSGPGSALRAQRESLIPTWIEKINTNITYEDFLYQTLTCANFSYSPVGSVLL